MTPTERAIIKGWYVQPDQSPVPSHEFNNCGCKIVKPTGGCRCLCHGVGGIRTE